MAYNNQTWRQKMIVERCCIECGNALANDVKGQKCIICKGKRRQQRKDRVKRGVCSRCNNSVVAGRTSCREHLIQSACSVLKISVEDYKAALAAANGKCQICLQQTYLQVDHDHVSKAVRAAICGPCNRVLAQSRENPQTLRRAADYLEKFNNIKKS